MADPRIKQIKIKTGVVKRLAKEKLMYEKEAEKEKVKLEKMQSSGDDCYMIRKQHLEEKADVPQYCDKLEEQMRQTFEFMAQAKAKSAIQQEILKQEEIMSKTRMTLMIMKLELLIEFDKVKSDLLKQKKLLKNP